MCLWSWRCFYCNFTSSVLLIRNLLDGCPVFSLPPPLLLHLLLFFLFLLLSQHTSYSFQILIPNRHKEMCLESMFVSRWCDSPLHHFVPHLLILFVENLGMYMMSVFSRLAICFQRNSSDFYIYSTLCFSRTATASYVIFKAAL